MARVTLSLVDLVRSMNDCSIYRIARLSGMGRQRARGLVLTVRMIRGEDVGL